LDGDIVLDTRKDEEGTGRRREQGSDLGLASDQIPGQNNIGYGLYDSQTSPPSPCNEAPVP